MNSPETKKQCLAFYIGNVRYCRNSLFDRLFIKKSIQAREAQVRWNTSTSISQDRL